MLFFGKSLALTSNTAQIGARFELYASIDAEVGKCILDGHLYFDALFQFYPFHFIADFGGCLTLKIDSLVDLHGTVNVEMTLSGPSPWHAYGRGDYDIGGIKGGFPIGPITFGGAEEPPSINPIDVIELIDRLKKEVEEPRNWNAQLPETEHMFVTLREFAPSKEVLVHPLGSLTFRQRLVPLNIGISMFGNQTISSEKSLFKITLQEGLTKIPKEIKDYFAPAQFFQMSDDEKLLTPSFQQMESGIHFGMDTIKKGEELKKPIEYEEVIIDPDTGKSGEKQRKTLSANILDDLIQYSATTRAPIFHTGKAKYRVPVQEISIRNPVYVLARTDNMHINKDLTKKEFTYAEAAEVLRDTSSEMRRILQVLPGYEGVES